MKWARRMTASVVLALGALAITGPAANAASVDQYSAQASGTTLSVNVQLPLGEVLGGVLKSLGITNGTNISERIAFSNAVAVSPKDGVATGSAMGQIFFGTLDPLLLQVSRLVGYTGEKLPIAEARLNGARSAKASLLSLDIPKEAPLIHVGVGETEATANNVGKLVSTHSKSSLASIKVDLASVLSNSQIQALLAPVEQLLDGQGGLIDQLNGALGTVGSTLKGAGLNVDLTIPKIKDLLNKPLLSIGIIESISDTGYKGAARTAHGVTRLANVDILGGFIHLDALTVDAFAQIDGTTAGAQATNAIQRIVGLKIGNNVININAGSIDVLGKTIQLPVDVQSLLKLTVDALGLKVAVAPKPQILRSATHARAAASTLHVELAPNVGGQKLFSVSVDGPAAVADVVGSAVQGARFVRIPTTGLGDNAIWFVGAMLIGLAVVSRKIVLSR